jgi:hypothetical protein
VRSPLSDLKDSTAYPAFFIAPAMNPRTVCRCHPILSMISASVAPFLRWSIATTWAVLLPSRGPAPSVLAAVFALGVFLVAVAFLLALAFAGAPLAAGAPRLALLSAFGVAGSAAGLAASASPWMRSQMRLAAALLFLKRFAGSTPGRPFQIATIRSAGQLVTSPANSFWLAKLSNGVVVAAVASSAEPNAVMLFFSIDRKRFHSESPWCRAQRGHDMDHSDLLEKQGNCSANRRRRRTGDWKQASRRFACGVTRRYIPDPPQMPPK